jgi:hypothetical protein
MRNQSATSASSVPKGMAPEEEETSRKKLIALSGEE